MKFSRSSVFLGAAVAAAMFWGVSAAHADTVNLLGTYSGSGTDILTGADGSGQNGKSSTVSATAVFSYDVTTGQLLIQLSNTTTQANLLGNDDSLTQIAFKLTSSLNVSNGSASGELATYVNGSPGTFTQATPANPTGTSAVNENADWGGGVLDGSGDPAEFTLLSAAGDNVAVTSLTDELTTTGGKSFKSFAGSSLDNTTAYGVIPTVSGPAASGNFIGNNPYTYGTVNLAFAVSGPVTASDISGINFIFGASDPPNAIVPGSPVPLPSAASSGLVLLGGMGGFRLLRKKMQMA